MEQTLPLAEVNLHYTGLVSFGFMSYQPLLMHISGLCIYITYVWFVANNSIKHQSFVYTQLNDQTPLFQTTQFSISQQY